jgi:hypothetical protein
MSLAEKHMKKGGLTASDIQSIGKAAEALADSLMPHSQQLDALYTFPLKPSLDVLLKRIEFPNGPYRHLTAQDVESLVDLKSMVDQAESCVNSDKASTQSRCELTLKMREVIYGLLSNYQQEELKMELANWCITVWGGVDRKKPASTSEKNQKDDKYRRMVRTVDSWDAISQIDSYSRIAQWSKYLAFCKPQMSAIFDSRVAYTFNWYLRNVAGAKRVPSLPTENRLLSVLDHRLIVAGAGLGWDALSEKVYADIAKVAAGENSNVLGIIESRENVIPKPQAYSYYLRVIREVADKLYDLEDKRRLTKVEMLLFALATTTVTREVLTEFSRLNRERYVERVAFAVPVRSRYILR